MVADLRVAWARRSQSVTLQLRATPKMTHVALYDHLGKAYPVAADKKGVFTLALSPHHAVQQIYLQHNID